MTHWFLFAAQGAVLAYALLGGVFLAFSDFIMRSLSLTSGASGVEAMQAINREVFRWLFMALFLGMGIFSLGVLIYSGMVLEGGWARLIAAGALIYLFGCFLVTVLFNVPLNEALAGLDAQAPDTANYWREVYLPRWTFWNSIRAAACAAASAMLMFGVIWGVQTATTGP